MLSDFGTEVPGEPGMPNQLSMASIQSIETLHRSGHANRDIARILGIDRGAVNKYVRRLRTAEALPAMPEAGSEDSQNQPNLRTGSGGAGPGSEASAEPQNRPNPHMLQTVSQTSGNSPGFPGRTGPKSLCGQYREMIAVKLDQGLSSVRIHQDLRSEHSFPGSYHSVRRFIEQLGVKSQCRFDAWKLIPATKLKSISADGETLHSPCEPSGPTHATPDYTALHES